MAVNQGEDEFIILLNVAYGGMLSFLDKVKFLETVQAVIRTGYSLCLIRLWD